MQPLHSQPNESANSRLILLQDFFGWSKWITASRRVHKCTIGAMTENNFFFLLLLHHTRFDWRFGFNIFNISFFKFIFPICNSLSISVKSPVYSVQYNVLMHRIFMHLAISVRTDALAKTTTVTNQTHSSSIIFPASKVFAVWSETTPLRLVTEIGNLLIILHYILDILSQDVSLVCSNQLKQCYNAFSPPGGILTPV